MNTGAKGLMSQYDDAWLIDGVRTPFAEYNTVLGLISPIDLGIKVAREIFRRSGRFSRVRWHGRSRQHGASQFRCLCAAAPHWYLFRSSH